MRPLLVPAVVLAALLAPGLAAGDHVYSHRFVFEGRLVGSDGLPLPGREVTFFSEGDEFVEPCPGEPLRNVTDAWGDFSFCFHKHALRSSTVTGVEVGNVTVRKPMDTGFRRTVVLLQDEESPGVAPPGWNDAYRIAGRVWQQGATTLEGVPVYGTALAGAPVNVTVAAGNATTNHTLETDAYGDFDYTLRLPEGVAEDDVEVVVESMGRQSRFGLSGKFHRTTVGIQVAPPASFRGSDGGTLVEDGSAGQDPGAVVGARFQPADDAPPGAGTPRVPWLLVAGLVALAALALGLKARQKR